MSSLLSDVFTLYSVAVEPNGNDIVFTTLLNETAELDTTSEATTPKENISLVLVTEVL